MRTRQVDGWEINEDGAWTVDGEVQKKYVPVPGMEMIRPPRRCTGLPMRKTKL